MDSGSTSGKRDLLVHRLRDAIFAGRYIAGERLRQQQIAAEYRVSPTPVREALRVLEAQGLVHHEPHRGVTVSDLAGTFDQVYRLRSALECLAVEMAVERMTDERADQLFALVNQIDSAIRRGDHPGRQSSHHEFHLYLYAGCGFPTLVNLITMVWSSFPWDELLNLPGLTSVHDHREIAVMAAARDARGASDRLRAHLDSVRAALSVGLRERQSSLASVSVRRPAADRG